MRRTAQQFREELLAAGNPEKAKHLSRFFKTEKGSYGEGDKFIGVNVPVNRAIARQYLHLSPSELVDMLRDEIHEIRLGALLCMVEQYKQKKTTDSNRQEIFDTYTANTRYINNWDLVDLTAPQIVGSHLLHRKREILYRWSESELLWEQRIAIVATLQFIREHSFDDTIAIAEKLRNHPHDLIQKAVGWMLREMGKRDKTPLKDFLDKYHTSLPRTLLRYAIEKLSPEERAYYMQR